MVYVNNDLRCENCRQKGDALIHVNCIDKVKKLCYSCVRGGFWRFLREGGYWRKVFRKPMYNNPIDNRVIKGKPSRVARNRGVG